MLSLFFKRRKKKMFIVLLSNWVEGSGTSYTEEFDHLDEYITAQDYILDYDGDLASKKVGEDIKISITDEEGRIAVQTYALKYDEDSGYSANRIYGNNDVAGTITKTVRLIFKLLKMLGEKIIGLFNK
jgi:hypothetical protein